MNRIVLIIAVVSVNFAENLSYVSIIIVSETTGEVVYSIQNSSPIFSNINLSGKSSGRYRINIKTDNSCLEGSFSL